MTLMTMYLHLGPFAFWVLKRVRTQIAEIDRGEWITPPRIPAPPTAPAKSRGPVLTAAE
jgi:hypothetical protein